jgi:hypothetical protein
MDGRFDETTKFPALFLRDGGLQVLDLGCLFPDEHDKSHIRDSADP